MSDKAAQDEDLIRRAYVNLTSVRDNMPQGYVSEKTLFQMFERALDQLQQTGADVSEWRLPRSAVGEIDSSEFLAKVQAVLAYFAILREKTPIGFRS